MHKRKTSAHIHPTCRSVGVPARPRLVSGKANEVVAIFLSASIRAFHSHSIRLGDWIQANYFNSDRCR
jgi:hypothetical protein